MRIFVTGPSCSGKTLFARQWAEADCIHLDHWRDTGEALARLRAGEERGRAEGPTIYEGIVSGRASDVEAFLAEIDVVFVLRAPFLLRLARAVGRDGIGVLGGFLRNEFHWRTFCRPLIERPRAKPAIREFSWTFEPGS